MPVRVTSSLLAPPSSEVQRSDSLRSEASEASLKRVSFHNNVSVKRIPGTSASTTPRLVAVVDETSDRRGLSPSANGRNNNEGIWHRAIPADEARREAKRILQQVDRIKCRASSTPPPQPDTRSLDRRVLKQHQEHKRERRHHAHDKSSTLLSPARQLRKDTKPSFHSSMSNGISGRHDYDSSSSIDRGIRIKSLNDIRWESSTIRPAATNGNDMIMTTTPSHPSQLPQEPPSLRTGTVPRMVKRLDAMTQSIGSGADSSLLNTKTTVNSRRTIGTVPPPTGGPVLVEPVGDRIHNGNKPFSYLNPASSSKISHLRAPSEVLYAQVVMDSDENGTSSKRTIHTSFKPSNNHSTFNRGNHVTKVSINNGQVRNTSEASVGTTDSSPISPIRHSYYNYERHSVSPERERPSVVMSSTRLVRDADAMRRRSDEDYSPALHSIRPTSAVTSASLVKQVDNEKDNIPKHTTTTMNGDITTKTWNNNKMSSTINSKHDWVATTNLKNTKNVSTSTKKLTEEERTLATPIAETRKKRKIKIVFRPKEERESTEDPLSRYTEYHGKDNKDSKLTKRRSTPIPPSNLSNKTSMQNSNTKQSSSNLKQSSNKIVDGFTSLLRKTNKGSAKTSTTKKPPPASTAVLESVDDASTDRECKMRRQRAKFLSVFLGNGEANSKKNTSAMAKTTASNKNQTDSNKGIIRRESGEYKSWSAPEEPELPPTAGKQDRTAQWIHHADPDVSDASDRAKTLLRPPTHPQSRGSNYADRTKSLDRRQQRSPSKSSNNKEGNLTYFGDSDSDRNKSRTDSLVRRSHSAAAHLDRVGKKRIALDRVGKPVQNSSESEDGSRMSRQSTSSQRSVYLHEAAVADIPPSSAALALKKRAASRDELTNNPGPLYGQRKVRRSLSLLAPFAPRVRRPGEGRELHYWAEERNGHTDVKSSSKHSHGVGSNPNLTSSSRNIPSDSRNSSGSGATSPEPSVDGGTNKEAVLSRWLKRKRNREENKRDNRERL